jgi:hypothetical protein
MTSPNSTEPNSKISLDSPDSPNNPFIWSNIALLAAVPWLLALSMAGLAVGDPVFPAWFEILLLGVPAIAVVTWLQWQQPFSPFSLWFLAKPADSLSERERQVLSLIKQSRNGWYTTGWIAASVAFVTGVIFCRIYLSAPLAQTIAPFPMGLRLFGIVWAEIFFLLSNVLLQAGISALRVQLTPESEVASLSPFAVEKVKNSFTTIGWQSPQLLKFFENNQIEEQVVSNDLPQIEESAQPEVIEEVSEIAIADPDVEESNEDVSEIAIAEFAEVDQSFEEPEEITEVSSELADQPDEIDNILVSELAEVEPEQLVTEPEPEELEPIAEVELSPEPNEMITDAVSDQPEIEEIQDLETTQIFTEVEHLETVIDHPEVEAEPIETAAEITDEVTKTPELEITQESENLADVETEAVATIVVEEFVEITQVVTELEEEVIVTVEDAEPIVENVDEEVIAAIEDTEEEVIVAIEDAEPIPENVDEEVIVTIDDAEPITESKIEEEVVIVAVENAEEEVIDEEVIVAIEDTEPIAENVDDVLETATEAEQEQEQAETTPENTADEPMVTSLEPLEVAETIGENTTNEQSQIDTAVENALMEFDINTVAKENKKTFGFAKKTRKVGSVQKKKGFGKSIKPSDDEIVDEPESIAIVEETAINAVEQSNDSDDLVTPTEETTETQKKSTQYLVEEFLVDKFLARIEELNNPNKDNENIQVDNSEPVNTSAPTPNNDEFADLEELIDRKTSSEESE